MYPQVSERAPSESPKPEALEPQHTERESAGARQWIAGTTHQRRLGPHSNCSGLALTHPAPVLDVRSAVGRRNADNQGGAAV